MKRRHFLKIAATSGIAFTSGDRSLLSAQSDQDLIRDISKHTLWRNRDGKGITWFHPRCCMIPRKGAAPQAMMTLQQITGSDYFGPVHWSVSEDEGQHWTDPAPIDSLGRRPVKGHEGLQEGVCDVVPEYHAATGTVLALGHNVYYRGPKFSNNDQLARGPVYTVRKEDGSWTEQKILQWDAARGSIYTNGCGQRVTMPDGDVILALSFDAGSPARQVCGARCSFDGETLEIRETGPALTLDVKRGLLEPSVTRFRDRIFVTIRAEDDRGYVAVSDDGLQYGEKKAWTWDDGEPLGMSTTQQHWLTHSDALYLVYTRRDVSNEKIIRWRSPLWLARVDPEKLCLIRKTERIVLPLVGDAVNDPDGVTLMGNFHVTNVSPTQSWVTVGEWMPKRKALGDTLLARIDWSRPNLLAPSHVSHE